MGFQVQFSADTREYPHWIGWGTGEPHWIDHGARGPHHGGWGASEAWHL